MISFGSSDGHSNALDFGDLAYLEGNVEYCVGVKFKELGAPASARFLFADGRINVNSDNGYGLERVNGSPGAWRVRHGNGTALGAVDTNMAITGTHSLFYSWGAGNVLDVYADGFLTNSQTLATARNANTLPFVLGNNSDKNDGYACAVAHFMYWHNQRGNADHAAAYHAGEVIPQADKLTFWYPGTVNPGEDEIQHVVPSVTGSVSLVADAVDAHFQGQLYVLQALEAAARRLRRNRFPMLIMPATVGPEGATLEVGDPANLAHYGIPRAESLIETREADQMARSGQAAFCFLGGIAFGPNTFQHGLELEEAEHEIGTFWSTLKLPFSIDEHRDGIAQRDNGAVKSFTRGTTAWLQQADGLVVRIGPGFEKMNHEGLWSEPARSNLIRNSNWALTSITTNWTDNTGDGSAAAETAVVLFKDTISYPRALKMTKGTGNTLWTADAIAVLTAEGKHRVQIWRQAAGSIVGSWRLQRSSDSFYWNDSTEAWQSGSVFNVMPVSATYAPHYSNPVDVPGNTNWTLDIGITSGLTDDEVYFGQVDIQNTRFACSPIVTGAAAYLQDADVLSYSIEGDAERQLVYAGRHTIRATVKALQNAGDLEDGDILVIAYGQIGATTDSYAVLYYEKPAGAAARFVFEVKPPAVSAVKAAYAINVVRGTSYELMGRLVDNSGFELGLPARTVSVLVDGVKGTDAVASANLGTAETDTELWLGSAPVSLGWDSACFVVSDLDIVQRAIPGEEALALR